MVHHTRGLEGPEEKQEYYEEQIGEIPHILDLTDLQEYRQDLEKKARDLKETVIKERKEAEERRIEAAAEKLRKEKEQKEQKQAENV